MKINSSIVLLDPERVEFLMEEKGLGDMPTVIPSVASMLLFNSAINPYKVRLVLRA